MIFRVSSLVLLACVLCGCSARRPSLPAESQGSFPLQRPSVVANDFLWHQQIVATVGGKAFLFQAYVGKEGDSLSVIGLSPMGTAWFELSQNGLEVQHSSAVPYALPIAPRYVLDDIQRCYFPISSDPPPRDGTRTVARGSEEVVETWRDGLLQERTFRGLAAPVTDVVVVRYEPAAEHGSGERNVFLENRRFGYTLRISTVDLRP